MARLAKSSRLRRNYFMSTSCSSCSFKVCSKDEGCLYKNFVVTCSIFNFVLWPLRLQTEDRSPDVTDGQTLPSTWLPAVCSMPYWAPSRSPALSKATFERRLCSVAREESSRNRSAAAPLPSYTAPPYVGHVVLSEALMRAGNLVWTLFFPLALQQLLKDSMSVL